MFADSTSCQVLCKACSRILSHVIVQTTCEVAQGKGTHQEDKTTWGTESGMPEGWSLTLFHTTYNPFEILCLSYNSSSNYGKPKKWHLSNEIIFYWHRCAFMFHINTITTTGSLCPFVASWFLDKKLASVQCVGWILLLHVVGAGCLCSELPKQPPLSL